MGKMNCCKHGFSNGVEVRGNGTHSMIWFQSFNMPMPLDDEFNKCS